MHPEAPAHGVWIAVCDGAKGLILENLGSAADIRLEVQDMMYHHSLPTHLQGSSAPGRAFGSGDRRAAMEQTDFHRQDGDSFLASFAAALERRLDTGNAQGLMLVAPPHALSILRGALGQTARKLLRGELARDYAGLPVARIEHNFRRLYEQVS
jgi:protein required for attachment to host cells